MTPVLLVCIVIGTMALVVGAVVSIRTLVRIGRTAEEISRTSRTARTALIRVQDATTKIHDRIDSLGPAVLRIRRMAERFNELGDRAARGSAAVLHGVEVPVRAAVRVARGVRIGTSFFINRVTNRLAHRRSATNGGFNHEQPLEFR